MLLTLDRFEGNYAVMEIRDNDSGDTIDMEKSKIPKGSKEGDIFEYDGEQLTPRPDLTAAKRAEIQARFDKLKKK